MTVIQDYQYGPLADDDNTRFIQLYPAAHFEDPIRVDIVERAYDASRTQDPVGYEALSYAWGSDEDSAYVFVGANSRLRVRHNVTQILRYLRDGITPGCTVRTLWIDAICINQADDEEKGKQVTMMGKLYACATSVLIWTGEPGCDLQALQRSFERKIEYTRDGEARFMQFFETGWFTRRWVVQEIMHAREAYIISGSGTMQWQQFRVFVEHLEQNVSYEAVTPHFTAILHRLSNLTAVRDTKSDELSQCDENTTGAQTDRIVAGAENMTTLLTRFSTTRCADDRDRIYALRSLSSTSIVVDYQVSVNELYDRLSKIEVIRFPMAIMSCAGSFGGLAASWVPDWRLPMRYRPFQSSLKYECSTLPVGVSLVTVENSLLTIQATFGGVVDSVVDPPGPEHETEERTLYRWGNYFVQHHAIGTPEQKSMDAMILYCALRVIPMEDDVADPHPSPYKAQLRSRWENILRRWNSYEKWNRKRKPILRLLSEANRIGLAHTKEGRSCFFTSAGLFGIGPDTIQIGDYLVNMPGCDSMMALRPVDAEKNLEQMYGDMGSSQHPAMTVVGDCWIPELVKSNRENTASNLRTFHIV
ncbi:hypothetical protein J4E85_000514 [Alternaria conjuncta]|uniref:uncharacterized protein n=1 Tax=Alternaria conjuncta TaxID=181017 RepID=UPI00221FC33F|nr:uncharacterized protein J4E85_000514 [Alternaria conjuncta]KAI4938075.1 hypothetical protein J4E85_000514 [Alternaria conjuncta]